MLTCLVSVLFTFYIQSVLKLKKKNNSGDKGLILCTHKCACLNELCLQRTKEGPFAKSAATTVRLAEEIKEEIEGKKLLDVMG